MPPERLAVLKTKIRAEQAKHPQRELFKAGLEMNRINLKKLSDGGVRVALGTDSGGAADRFFIQGYFEHREMELMVQAGMTPMQVIQSFSKGASEALGIDKEFGTLAKGKAADLLVLEKIRSKYRQHADHPDHLSGRQEIRVERPSLQLTEGKPLSRKLADLSNREVPAVAPKYLRGKRGGVFS